MRYPMCRIFPSLTIPDNSNGDYFSNDAYGRGLGSGASFGEGYGDGFGYEWEGNDVFGDGEDYGCGNSPGCGSIYGYDSEDESSYDNTPVQFYGW